MSTTLYFNYFRYFNFVGRSATSLPTHGTVRVKIISKYKPISLLGFSVAFLYVLQNLKSWIPKPHTSTPTCSGVARAFPEPPTRKIKMRKKMKKSWGKIRIPTGKKRKDWGNVPSCPPGSDRLAAVFAYTLLICSSGHSKKANFQHKIYCKLKMLILIEIQNRRYYKIQILLL